MRPMMVLDDSFIPFEFQIPSLLCCFGKLTAGTGHLVLILDLLLRRTQLAFSYRCD